MPEQPFSRLALALIGGASIVAACAGEPPPQPTSPAVVAPLRPNIVVDAPEPAASVAQRAALPDTCRGRATPELQESATLAARHSARCYNQMLPKDPTLSGVMAIDLRLEADGSVTSARVKTSTLPNALGDCVVDTLKKAHYSPPDGGCLVVIVPLQFMPPEGANAHGFVFGRRVKLSGTLVWRDAARLPHGVPTTGKVPFLVLDAPVDVGTGEGEINNVPAQIGQREMQVGFNDLEKARPFFTQHVTVDGELTPQLTAHHHSPVVLVLANLVP
jgi:hypothetical protein